MSSKFPFHLITVTIIVVSQLVASPDQFVLPEDSDGIEYMLHNIEHFSLSEIRETIALIESKAIWMMGHRSLQWHDLRRRLQYETSEREYLITGRVIPIPVPDPHTFRALTFEINPAYPKLIFEFNSGVRNGPRFNITIGSDRQSLSRDLKVTIPPQRQGGDRGWFRSTKIEGTLLFMLQPNGIGLQLFFGDKAVLITDKLLNFRIAPTVEIRGYQQNTHSLFGHQHNAIQNVNVIKDMYCLTPRDLLARYPTLKPVWVGIQIKVAGRSLFDDERYWIPPDSPGERKKKLGPNPRKWGRKIGK